MLKEVLLGTNTKGKAIVITTFSSHIARLKSIAEFGQKLGRKVVFLGRSLNRYVSSAINIDMCPFRGDIELVSYRNQIERKLKNIDKNRKEYMVVCTGHQGEPGSILDRLARDKMHFNFKKNDHVIFSSSVIPTEINIRNREKLDNILKRKGARLFNNIHVSGHAGREDLRDFINMINPEHIIPAHGDHRKISPMVELAEELGYKDKRNVHLINDKQTLRF